MKKTEHQERGWEERFDQEFLLQKSDKTQSGFEIECDPEFAKSFISQVITEEVEKERQVAHLWRLAIVHLKKAERDSVIATYEHLKTHCRSQTSVDEPLLDKK